MKNEILMIIPYFGKWPVWFDLYLVTVKKNPMIDFHYFTDCTIPKEIPSNTYFHHISFDDYIKFIYDKTEINLPRNPVKLCDLKPFYGIIHKDLIEKEDYKWWGFGDIDLAYGDLTKILKKTQSNKYDLITTHIKCVSGHFTLIRYNSDLTYKVFEVPNIKKLVEDEKSLWVDEHYFSDFVRPKNIRIIDKLWYSFGLKMGLNRNLIYHSIGKILRSRHYMEESCTTFTPKPGEKYILDLNIMKWSMGEGFYPDNVRSGDNLPYLHFLLFKEKEYNHSGYAWKDGFYKITERYKWLGNEKVEFSSEGITLLK